MHVLYMHGYNNYTCKVQTCFVPSVLYMIDSNISRYDDRVSYWCLLSKRAPSSRLLIGK